ncbi:hypothetical protein L5G28_16190 [Gordonia sp. HY285]|uniref:hypothetical protein n=1 Tax=Gordonia liuliyuniae TaxID=2911517 RepID=UPI001F1BE917|nr:hypothetical protein [Gordonia liuliyuniae]MCF8611686.1 hypothetical protein [Gordonia liuliyuniae]
MFTTSGQPAPRRSRRRIVFAAIAALLIAGASGGIGYAFGSSGTEPTTTSASIEDETLPVADETTPEAIPVTASDITLDVLTEEKQCFGSAGCNVTISLSPTYAGTMSTLEGRSFKVLYEIHGGDDPILDRFTMTGTRVSIDETLFVQTASSDAVITAEVTQVIETTYGG